jgi:hypothetical protein
MARSFINFRSSHSQQDENLQHHIHLNQMRARVSQSSNHLSFEEAMDEGSPDISKALMNELSG